MRGDGPAAHLQVMTTSTTTPTELSAELTEVERLRAINHELCSTLNMYNRQGANGADELRAARALIVELEDANRPAAVAVYANRREVAVLTERLAQEREMFESTLLATAARSRALEAQALHAASTSITTPVALNALRFEVTSFVRDECALHQVPEDRLPEQAADRVIGTRRLVERIEADAGAPHVHVTARGCQS